MSVIHVDPRRANEERALRVDLAAAFRLVAMNDWHEAVANHLSVAASPDGTKFLINPRWKHFSRIRASDLLLLDATDETTLDQPNPPDPSAWCIHSALHALVPQARCVLHVHSRYATALSSLKDPTVHPVDQNTARFFNRVAYDFHFGGIADNVEEGRRLAAVMGDKRVMVMGNHGVLVIGATIAEAYDTLYYFEKSARTLLDCYATGQPLSVLSDEVAERTARDWDEYTESWAAHFEEMKAILDERQPDYRQ